MRLIQCWWWFSRCENPSAFSGRPSRRIPIAPLNASHLFYRLKIFFPLIFRPGKCGEVKVSFSE
jgi:hypothetical protein